MGAAGTEGGLADDYDDLACEERRAEIEREIVEDARTLLQKEAE